MKLSKGARKTAKQLFQHCLVEKRADDGRIRQVAAALIDQKPTGYISILKELHRLLRLEVARHHAIVQSAVEILPDEVTRLTNELRTRYGHDLTTEFAVDPSLLGGLRIQIANDVIDGSVKARLQLLEDSLSR